MTSLLDPPTPDEQRLCAVITEAYLTYGHWPIYQYVAHTLAQDGLDLDQVLLRLPTWQHYYSSCKRIRAGGGSELEDQMRVSVLGLARSGDRGAAALIGTFLAALQTAITLQGDVTPRPDRVVEVKIAGSDLAERVVSSRHVVTNARTLGYLLSGEPATWSGVSFNHSEPEAWTWDLSRRSLMPFADLGGVDEYLQRLEGMVGIPEGAVSAPPVPPLTLPMMLDYVNAVWRVEVGPEPLFSIGSFTQGAKLAQPCLDFEDFESRCSALSDVLSTLRVPLERAKQEGALQWLKRYLKGRLADEVFASVDEALADLQAIIALRASHQHQGAASRGVKSMARLQLPYLTTSWTAAWEAVAGRAGAALDTIRWSLTHIS